MAKKKAKEATPPISGRLASWRSPEALARLVPYPRPAYARILGLDLATNCGVAFVDVVPGFTTPVTVFAGQLDLHLGPYETGPLRIVRLKAFLEALRPDLVAYEKVRNVPAMKPGGSMSPTQLLARVASAASLIGALEAAASEWCEVRGIPLAAFTIQAIKQFVTGGGRASKVDVISAVNSRYGTELPTTDIERTGADNIADAIAICAMAVEHYSGGAETRAERLANFGGFVGYGGLSVSSADDSGPVDDAGDR